MVTHKDISRLSKVVKTIVAILAELSSRIAAGLAAFSLVLGVLSVILNTIFMPWLCWFAFAGLPFTGAAIFPGALAALLPRASKQVRIAGLIGLALGVLSIGLLILLIRISYILSPMACAG